MNMNISIKHELECQALLAVRFSQDLLNEAECEGTEKDFQPRVMQGDDPKDLTYQLMPLDPIPEGMTIPEGEGLGEFIYGRLTRVSKGRDLPIFTGTGS